MQFVVAYDGSVISATALVRAARLADGVDGAVTAVTVLPSQNAQYARDRGWLDSGEPWERKRVVGSLRGEVNSIVSGTKFTYRMVDRYAPRGKIGRVLRTTAEEEGVDVFVIGTENAGRIFSSMTTVTHSVSSGDYDLFVVQRSEPDIL